MDLHKCLELLRPGARFSVSVSRPPDLQRDYDSVEWPGPTVKPTLAECQAAWPQVLAAEAAAATAAQSAATNEGTIRQQAEAALADLRTYRDRATTTTAQDKAAIKLLVRVAIGLIRLVLRRLDGAA